MSTRTPQKLANTTCINPIVSITWSAAAEIFSRLTFSIHQPRSKIFLMSFMSPVSATERGVAESFIPSLVPIFWVSLKLPVICASVAVLLQFLEELGMEIRAVKEAVHNSAPVDEAVARRVAPCRVYVPQFF